MGAVGGLATEIGEHRRISSIGAPQRHFRLEPALITPEGVCTGVVVITGARATYVYPSNFVGDIAEYETVATAPRGTAPGVILAVMGYLLAGAKRVRGCL